MKLVAVRDRRRIQHIRREVHALSRLDHPGIVRILQTGVEHDVPWYAMEVVEGRPLSELCGASDTTARPLDSAALGIIRRLCDALAYLHGEGLVHRDVKPDNVLVRPDGHPVLVDFGLASRFGGRLGREHVETISIRGGTLPYMAPEQIRGGMVDGRADLYALGAMLFEVLTGRPPFRGSTTKEVIRQHLAEPPPLPSDLISDVPDALNELVLRLLAKDPRDRIGYASDVARTLAEMGAPNGSRGPTPRVHLYEPAFVGQAGSRDRVTEILGEALQGSGGLVMLEGPSGSGKTRLAIEAGRIADQRGALVLGANCSEQGAVPYEPFRQLLASLAERCVGGALPETRARLIARAGILAPYEESIESLSDGPLPQPSPLGPDEARLRVQLAVSEVLETAASERPLVLILDDLQWVDELSLELLELWLAGGTLAGHALLVLVTCRSEGATERVLALGRGPAGRVVGLVPLRAAEVGSLVADMLAFPVAPSGLAELVHDLSEGNPFYVSEILRTAVEEGVITRSRQGRWQLPEPGATLPLPRTLTGLIAKRLESLPAAARTVLDSLAVLGVAVPPDLLASLAGLTEAEAWEGCAELLRRHLAREDGGGDLGPAHDRVSAAALETLDPLYRADVCRRVALVLEDCDRAGLRAHRGRLWEAAGNRARARSSYLSAAAESQREHSPAAVVESLTRYLALVDDPSPESIAARADLASALSSRGRTAEAESQLGVALEEAHALEDPASEALVHRTLGDHYQDCGQVDRARQMYEDALETARRLERWEDEGPLLNDLGTLAMRQGRMADSRRLLDAALECHRNHRSRGNEAIALANYATLFGRMGQLADAVPYYQQALSLYREEGDRRGEAVAITNLAVLENVRGNPGEASRLFEEALATMREIGDIKREGQVLGSFAVLRQAEGRLAEARRLAEDALLIHRRTLNRWSEGIVMITLAEIDLFEGRPGPARETLEAALDISREVQGRRAEGAILAALGDMARLIDGDDGRALRLLRQALSILTQAQDSLELAKAICKRGHLALARGDDAQGFLDEATELAAKQDIGRDSELGESLAMLEKACRAQGAGEALFRGQCEDDIPPPLRAWLQSRSS